MEAQKETTFQLDWLNKEIYENTICHRNNRTFWMYAFNDQQGMQSSPRLRQVCLSFYFAVAVKGVEMEFTQFIQWTFYGVIGFSSIFAVSILSSLKNSVNELNSKIAVIIEKTAWHEKWLERHDDEINKINIKKGT